MERVLWEMANRLDLVDYPESDIYTDLGRIAFYRGIYQELSGLWKSNADSHHAGHKSQASSTNIEPRDYFKEAIELWQQAASRGSAKGKYYLGLAYCSGRIEQDLGQKGVWEKGIKWLERAKKQG